MSTVLLTVPTELSPSTAIITFFSRVVRSASDPIILVSFLAALESSSIFFSSPCVKNLSVNSFLLIGSVYLWLHSPFVCLVQSISF